MFVQETVKLSSLRIPAPNTVPHGACVPTSDKIYQLNLINLSVECWGDGFNGISRILQKPRYGRKVGNIPLILNAK